MASMAPTFGGQYHWVCMLAPPSYQKSFGYITGWVALIGWQAALTSTALLAGTQMQSIVGLTQGLSFGIGIMGSVFAFAGGDAVIHLSEEVRHASTVVPCGA
ncbi:amino acid transporter [Apiospora arundinis]|uniref:Amino acid transporter n=1 Tax=Apiospora arundinis TaxID=335852 RepID=A0ABR2JC35_9PEZI